jgi:asparagine synthase
LIAPLSNLLAIQEPDAGARLALAAALRSSNRFNRIEEAGDGWLVAVRNLPGTSEPSAAVTGAGFWFAQGRDVWEAQAGHGENSWRDYSARVSQQPESLHELPGDFTFFHFDAQGVTAVRSVGGHIPIYWWKSHGRWVLATCFPDVALPPIAPDDTEPDFLSCLIRVYNGYYYVDNRTPLRAVSSLPQASFIRLNLGSQTAPKRYWQAPRPVRRLPSAEEGRATLARFRELLLHEIDRQIDPDRANMVSLSGGMDSSALCYILKRHLKARLWTVSVLVKAPSVRERELSYINQVLEECSVERSWIIDWDEADLLRYIAKPAASLWPEFWPMQHLVDEMAPSERPATFINGGFADQVCGSSYTHPDWTRTLNFWQMLKVWRQWPGGWRAPARWFKHRLHDVWYGKSIGLGSDCVLGECAPVHLKTEHEAALRKAWKAAAAECPERPGLRMHWELHCAGQQWHWNAYSHLGIRFVVPFQTRGLIELAMQCHPVLQVGAGNPGIKRLMRESLQDLVAPRILQRPDKGVAWNERVPIHYVPPPAGWAEVTLRMAPSAIKSFPVLDNQEQRALLALDCILRAIDSKLIRNGPFKAIQGRE